MAKRRDDFLESTKRLLRERAGNQCSKPGCRVVTTAAAERLGGVNNIGAAAHICAAAPGGARYRPEMTKEERRSPGNGIWLCRNHADEIDNDEDRFPESLLRQWKQDAEESSKSQVGRPLPKPSDITTAVAAALTGTAREFVPTAISNTHKATAQVLRELDPRFHIETSFQQGTTSFTYHAKEDVPLKMTVAAEHAREFMEKYQRLMTHGDDVKVDASAVAFQGSKLFQEMRSFTSGGNLNIESERKEAITRLRFVQSDTGVEEAMPDAAGSVHHGTQALTFVGSLFGGFIAIAYTACFVESAKKGRITVAPRLTSWQGKPVNRLPYLNPIQAFLDKLANGWVLKGALEVEGLRLFSFDLDQLSEDKDGMAEYLRYLQAASQIADFLGVPIAADIDYLPTVDEFKQVVEAAKIARKEFLWTEQDIAGPIVSPLVVNENAANVKLLQEKTEPTLVKFVENEGRALPCMGKTLRMPPRETMFLNITPKVDVPPSGLKPGDTIDVEWVRAKGFQMTVEYVTDD